MTKETWFLLTSQLNWEYLNPFQTGEAIKMIPQKQKLNLLYLFELLLGMSVGSELLKTWQDLLWKQALGGHPSKWLNSAMPLP